jgi:hypothetical protein
MTVRDRGLRIENRESIQGSRITEDRGLRIENRGSLRIETWVSGFEQRDRNTAHTSPPFPFPAAQAAASAAPPGTYQACNNRERRRGEMRDERGQGSKTKIK